MGGGATNSPPLYEESLGSPPTTSKGGWSPIHHQKRGQGHQSLLNEEPEPTQVQVEVEQVEAVVTAAKPTVA